MSLEVRDEKICSIDGFGSGVWRCGERDGCLRGKSWPEYFDPGYSCALGGLVFDNFSAVIFWTPPPAAVVNIGSGSVTNGVVYLNFNPNMVTPPDPMDMWFMFRVVGGVNQVDLQVGGLGASIDEIICDSAGLDPNGGCAGVQLANLSASSGQPRQWVYLPGQNFVSPIWVFKDIYVTGLNGHLTQFSESFHVPEPLTLTLIGSGLLGFGLLRRRLKK